MTTTGDERPGRRSDLSDVWTTAPRPRTGGRPRDVDLTRRLLDSALLVLAERGFRQCNAALVTELAGAGKAGLYRRWPDTTSLLAEAVAGAALVQTPPPGATAEEDLVALLGPWTRPLTVHERAAAAVLGPAQHEPALRAALDVAVLEPLAAAATAIVDRQVARGHPVAPVRRRTFQRLLQALWLSRYCSPGPPGSDQDVRDLVQHVLVPLLR